jgi:hypothetical protein
MSPPHRAIVPQVCATFPQIYFIFPQDSAMTPQPRSVIPQFFLIIPQISAMAPQPGAIVPQVFSPFLRFIWSSLKFLQWFLYWYDHSTICAAIPNPGKMQ